MERFSGEIRKDLKSLKGLKCFYSFKVPPAELEAILLSNPKIKDAAVIGVPDESTGEKVIF